MVEFRLAAQFVVNHAVREGNEYKNHTEDYTIYQKCNQLLTENMYQNIIQKYPLYYMFYYHFQKIHDHFWPFNGN